MRLFTTSLRNHVYFNSYKHAGSMGSKHDDSTCSYVTHARANIIGEHTDYTGGLVLPFLLAPHLKARAILRERMSEYRFFDEDNQPYVFTRATQLDSLAIDSRVRYPFAAIRCFEHHYNIQINGIDLHITSTIHAGAGISSSAAVLVAVLGVLHRLYEMDITPDDLAILAQKCENEYLSSPCGLMDQTVIAYNDVHAALYIDFSTSRPVVRERVPVSDALKFVVIPSGITHTIAGESGYTQRVQECSRIARCIGHNRFYEITISELEKNYSLLDDDVLCRRLRHIVTENQRVRDCVIALKEHNTQKVFDLINQSHTSLSEDYQVSTQEIEMLVQAVRDAGAQSCRIMGGGFGGSVLCVLATASLDGFIEMFTQKNPSYELIV